MGRPAKEPKYLYHGSMFDTQGEPLYPGIHHTGELVVWDGGLETNEFLYTTTSAKHAILLGLGSFVEKKLDCTHYQVREKEIIVSGASQSVTEKDLKDVVIYLYTIVFHDKDGWYKNNNPYNHIDTEWKTTHSISTKHYLKAEVEILQWLKQNGYRLVMGSNKE